MASHAARKILVVGGNGFIGSAVCRAALSKGMEVTSVSSSGRPYTTPKGHSPAWTSKVTWLRGDALAPETFADVLPEIDGVVHTIGTLIEGAKYKTALNKGDVPGLWQALAGTRNPLEKEGSYEVLNRDTALRVCEAFVASGEGRQYTEPRPFVYISAEDIYRPIIPAGYIESKREAERGIEQLLPRDAYRGVYIRASLVYHAHFRPLTTPPATFLDLSASIQESIPKGLPTPSSILRSISPGTFLDSVANALSIPPIHVDQVGQAVAIALGASSNVRGVVNVAKMRELLGWTRPGSRIDAREVGAA